VAEHGGMALIKEPLRGLPAFLRYLGTFPAPDDLAQAIVHGPLCAFEATDALIMRDDGAGCLIPHGWNRSIEALGGRIPPIPVSSALPIAQACREGEPVIIHSDRLHEDYPAASIIEALVGADRMPRGNLLVAAPITCQGRGVGGFAAWVNTGISSDDLPLLAALSSALGLWLTHPASGALAKGRVRPDHLLSARQILILRMVGQGATNRAIAAHLGFSETTTKLEISRTMSALKARDRLGAAQVASNLGILGSNPPATAQAPGSQHGG